MSLSKALLTVGAHKRNQAEVLVAPKVIAARRAFEARELEMAGQLVDALFGQFDPSAVEDRRRPRVLDLIDKEAAGLPTNLSVARQRKLAPTPLADSRDVSELRCH